MQSRHASDSDTAETIIDPKVNISMVDDQLVVCAPAHLDLEMTKVLVIAAASAVAAGSTVMIDLDPDTASDELIARRPLSTAANNCVTSSGGPVELLSAGYVRLSTRDGHWTIDLGQGRLCRSDDPIEPHFVGHDDWIHICALWVTQTSVTALAKDGTYLSSFAAWTTETQPQRLTRT